MISFELSNGDPCGPHVPATLEDDQYVEYQLEDLAGFPSTAEEEERVSELDDFYIVKFTFDEHFGFYLRLICPCYSDVHGSSDGVTEGHGSTKSTSRTTDKQ